MLHSASNPPTSNERPALGARAIRVGVWVIVAGILVCFASPAVALVSGAVFALAGGADFGGRRQTMAKWLLQGCVILLGFGMDLPVVLRVGADGSLFTAVTIGATLLAGWGLGRWLGLGRHTRTLIAAGTAICGGSAIAAVSAVIAASEAEIAVSIGAVFLCNAIALYVFPLVGHWLDLSQAQFGLWAGVAIHDLSSVVGAGLSYGPDALATATAVKLSRTLWIIPVTLALAVVGTRPAVREGLDQSRRSRRGHVAIPWFIGLFVLASLARGLFPGLAAWAPLLSEAAHRGMILMLFLIGMSLSLPALRVVGWRTVTTGLLLWIFVSVGSLLAILTFRLAA